MTYCLSFGPAVYAQKLPFTYYTTANGLLHNRTHVVRQDGKGYIWIGTDLGIDRYDGRTFKHFPCPENTYRSGRYACRYKDNVIFCVDHFGIAICCGDSVRFIRLEKGVIGAMDGCVAVNDTAYYVVDMTRGLYCLQGGIAKKVEMPKPIVETNNFIDITIDRKNNIWLLCADGLILFQNSEVQHPQPIHFFDKTYVNTVRQDRNGDIYVACHTGVFRYTEAQCSSINTVVPERIFPPVTEITALAFDEDNHVWMSSTFKGLLKYNKQTKSIAYYGIANGVVSQNVWDILFDQEKNMWLASENGVCKLTTQNY
jgi:ligand-binding sensor domain-containing protein